MIRRNASRGAAGHGSCASTPAPPENHTRCSSVCWFLFECLRKARPVCPEPPVCKLNVPPASQPAPSEGPEESGRVWLTALSAAVKVRSRSRRDRVLPIDIPLFANSAVQPDSNGAYLVMKILEFAFIIYPATNLAQSRGFYEGILGLTPASVTDGDEFYIEYEIGPHTLGIGNEPFQKPSGDGPHVVLEVGDFDGAIEHLRRHSVPFAVEPFVAAPGCRAAVVLNPDGNKLGIHKRKV